MQRLVARGDHYRTELNRIHARLIRLYPEDERLRRWVTKFDRQLESNIDLLGRYFSRQAAGAAGEPKAEDVPNATSAARMAPVPES